MEKHSKSQRKSLKKQFKRTLTEREGVVGFKPTPVMAAHWFRKLNQMLFDNKLRGCVIHIRKLHHDWGRCVADWDNRHCRKGTFDQRVIPYHKTEVFYRIELHCKFPKWKDFIETLAHEMVHLYQMQVIKDPYSNHNENFYSFRNKFNSVGLRLYR
ncbi:MAG: hypothetical protein CBB97_13360 [Candidatus Endolissoclinum sp. TMED37]|nr:MAG: hypothetical protein CBB97_13360 [Candidatus Endolissoclinum sp. TMED37]|tara:strand:+ start:210 stop:677 length:468 start_codon:yes stop_codon:yes gene_type:complete